MGSDTLLFSVCGTQRRQWAPSLRLSVQLLTLLKLISAHFWLWWEDSFINSIHVCCLQSRQYCLLMWGAFGALSPSYANAFLLLVLEWRILDEAPSPASGDGLWVTERQPALSSWNPWLGEVMGSVYPRNRLGWKTSWLKKEGIGSVWWQFGIRASSSWPVFIP